MTNISLDLSNKIPNEIIEIIKAVNDVADDLDISTLLIGATARDLVLQHGYGLPKSKATRDIDFGIAVKNWSEYEKVKRNLLETKKFKQTQNIEHRLIEVSTSIEVDLVPFGEIESEDKQITWQQSENKMNVAGFIEAFEISLNVKLSKELIVNIVSPVGLAILKIIAWNDRFSNKDSSDIWLVLENYLDISNNEDRIYENYAEWLEDADYDYKIAGAKLLGRDIAEVVFEETKAIILEILDDNKKVEKLSFQIVRSERMLGDGFANVLSLINAVKDAIKSVS